MGLNRPAEKKPGNYYQQPFVLVQSPAREDKKEDNEREEDPKGRSDVY